MNPKKILTNRTAHYVHMRYRNSAKQRGKPFTLTVSDVAQHIFEPCVYCGAEPTNILTASDTKPYNGLDRVDNTKGYTPDNVVPCCKFCNIHKKGKLRETFENQLQMQQEHEQEVKIRVAKLREQMKRGELHG